MNTEERIAKYVYGTNFYKCGESFSVRQIQSAIPPSVGKITASRVRQVLNGMVDRGDLDKISKVVEGHEEIYYIARSELRAWMNKILLSRVPPECKGYSPRWC